MLKIMPVRTLLPLDEKVLATAKVFGWKLVPHESAAKRTPLSVELFAWVHGSTLELVSILKRKVELLLHNSAASMKAASKSGEPDTVGLPGELAKSTLNVTSPSAQDDPVKSAADADADIDAIAKKHIAARRLNFII